MSVDIFLSLESDWWVATDYWQGKKKRQQKWLLDVCPWTFMSYCMLTECEIKISKGLWDLFNSACFFSLEVLYDLSCVRLFNYFGRRPVRPGAILVILEQQQPCRQTVPWRLGSVKGDRFRWGMTSERAPSQGRSSAEEGKKKKTFLCWACEAYQPACWDTKRRCLLPNHGP